MKIFNIALDITSKTYEGASAYVEAETLEEAVKLFEENPYDYDWDDWDTFDSETLSWEVDKERCYYDERETERMEKKNAEVQSND